MVRYHVVTRGMSRWSRSNRRWNIATHQNYSSCIVLYRIPRHHILSHEHVTLLHHITWICYLSYYIITSHYIMSHHMNMNMITLTCKTNLSPSIFLCESRSHRKSLMSPQLRAMHMSQWQRYVKRTGMDAWYILWMSACHAYVYVCQGIRVCHDNAQLLQRCQLIVLCCLPHQVHYFIFIYGVS